MSGIEAEDKVVPAAEMKKLQERIRRLERLLGKGFSVKNPMNN